MTAVIPTWSATDSFFTTLQQDLILLIQFEEWLATSSGTIGSATFISSNNALPFLYLTTGRFVCAPQSSALCWTACWQRRSEPTAMDRSEAVLSIGRRDWETDDYRIGGQGRRIDATVCDSSDRVGTHNRTPPTRRSKGTAKTLYGKAASPTPGFA